MNQASQKLHPKFHLLPDDDARCVKCGAPAGEAEHTTSLDAWEQLRLRGEACSPVEPGPDMDWIAAFSRGLNPGSEIPVPLTPEKVPAFLQAVRKETLDRALKDLEGTVCGCTRADCPHDELRRLVRAKLATPAMLTLVR